jgi:hypothetical protein
MTINKLSNPHNFVKECKTKGITYDYLLEAINCIGQQKVCEMFIGKSSRGGSNNISQGTLKNWIATFEYSLSNPDIKDNDPFQSRLIEKKKDLYDNFIKLVNTKIDEHTLKSWETISINKLGDEAIKYGITLGVRNSKSVKNLRERMKEMWYRRKTKFWDINDVEIYNSSLPNIMINISQNEYIDYRMKNIISLKEIAKDRNIVSLHKSKDEIIKLLEEYDSKIDNNKNTDKVFINYEKMNSRQLKELAKNRGFNKYNNVNNTNLILLHKKYDEEIENKKLEDINNVSKDLIEYNIKEFELKNENDESFPIHIRDDGMVNVTMLCKAGNKKFYHYERNEQTQSFIKVLKNNLNITYSELIIVKNGGDFRLQGTWCHRLIAIDCARWMSPLFHLQIIKWTDEILTKGFVKIDKPLLPILERNNLDLEAEELEKECNILNYSNQYVLYIAYIGENGLVKIGSSDCRIIERESKHISCESLYPQFRFIKIFPISSGCIEKLIHNMLTKYKYLYNKQVEIYKPIGTLKEFIDMISKILEENDLKYQIIKKDKIIMELINENIKLKKEIELKYKI